MLNLKDRAESNSVSNNTGYSGTFMLKFSKTWMLLRLYFAIASDLVAVKQLVHTGCAFAIITDLMTPSHM